ncbi:MAG: nitrous oxide reductase family maturation protein NosD, partial [Methanococcaceae archaeon]
MGSKPGKCCSFYVSNIGNNTSIQSAVDNAQNGDTIFVNPGVYQENIRVNKEVKITASSGQNQNNHTYVISTTPGANVFSVSASNVTIEGFYIFGNSPEIQGTQTGIYLDGTQNCSLISNSLVFNNMGISLNNARGNHLESNLISLGNQGITLVNSGENRLLNNLVLTNINGGIFLNSSANNTLNGNSADSGSMGIFFGSAQGNILTNNLISKNEFGIYGQNSQNNTITANSLYLNGVGAYFTGSVNNSVYQNEFFNLYNAQEEQGNNTWNMTAGNFWHD